MYRLPPPLGLATSPSARLTMEQRHRVQIMLADVTEQVHWNDGFEGDQKNPYISQRQLLMVLQHPGQIARLTQHVGACTIEAAWRGWAVRKTQVGLVAARRRSQKVRTSFREKCSSTMGAKSHLARLSQYVSNKQGNISDIKSTFQQRALKHAHRRIPLSPRSKARNSPSATPSIPSANEVSISALSADDEAAADDDDEVAADGDESAAAEEPATAMDEDQAGEPEEAADDNETAVADEPELAPIPRTDTSSTS